MRASEVNSSVIHSSSRGPVPDVKGSTIGTNRPSYSNQICILSYRNLLVRLNKWGFRKASIKNVWWANEAQKREWYFEVRCLE